MIEAFMLPILVIYHEKIDIAEKKLLIRNILKRDTLYFFHSHLQSPPSLEPTI